MKIDRSILISEFATFTREGNGVVIGHPGVGKTVALLDLREKLKAGGTKSLIIPVESLGEASPSDLEQFSGRQGDFIRNLADAVEPSDKPAVLLFDGFDAARGEKQRGAILNLIRKAISQLKGKWNIIVTVRTFDAQKSQRLLELFPDKNSDSTSCRTFSISPLIDSELEQAFAQLSGLREIFNAGTDELRSLLRIPFNLWLVEKMLQSTEPARFSQITSEVQLLDLYWNSRVRRAEHSEQRSHILTLITREMVVSHTLTVRKDGVYRPEIDVVWTELLSDEILSPAPQSDQRVGFTHNILFDFAVSVLLLDNEPRSLAQFVAQEPNRPLFLRPSLVYHFTRLWHVERLAFWRNFWGVISERESALRNLTRLVLPSVVISEARTIDDLNPFVEKLRSREPLASEAIAFVMQALRILSSNQRELWVEFIEIISEQLDSKFAWDAGVNITTIVSKEPLISDVCRARCGRVGRRIIFWARGNSDVNIQEWLKRLITYVAIPIVGKTYATDPGESRRSFEPILQTVGHPNFSIEALHRLIDEMEHFFAFDPDFAAQIYKTVFSYEEKSEDITQIGGSVVVPMSSNRRQDYDMCRYSLMQLFQKFLALALPAALSAGIQSIQAFTMQRHVLRHLRTGISADSLVKAFTFRGRQAKISEDASSIWDERYRHDREMELADHIFNWLEAILGTGATANVDTLLDIMAEQAGVAVLWARLLRVGAHHPVALGQKLWEMAAAPAVLACTDTRYSLADFLSKAFLSFTNDQKREVERAITHLPTSAPGRNADWLEGQRDDLLRVLDLNWLLTSEAQERKAALGSEIEEVEPTFTSRTSVRPYTEELHFSQNRVDVTAPANAELRATYAPLKDWLEKGKDPTQMDALLPFASKLLGLLESGTGIDPNIVAAGWTHLMGFAEAGMEATDMSESVRYPVLRNIILSAARQIAPEPNPERDSAWTSPTWSHAPRNQGAQLLPCLTTYGRDEEAVASIVRLAADPVPSVRFLLMSELWRLNKYSSDTLWPLLDQSIRTEKNRVVLQGIALSVWHLTRLDKASAASRVRLMLEFVNEEADEDDWNARAQLVGIVTDSAVEGDQWAIDQINVWTSDAIANVGAVTVAGNRLSQFMVPGATPQQLSSARSLLLLHLDAVAAALTRMNTDQTATPAERRSTYFRKLYGVIDHTVTRIYFALDVNPNIKREENRITDDAVREKLFRDSIPVLQKVLSFGNNPSTGFLLAPTAHYFMQLLNGVVKFDPPLVLSLAAQVVNFSRRFNYNLDSLAAREAVKLIESLLTDYRDQIQEETSIRNLLDILDAFTEVGWPEAVNLVWRLDEIYR
jgi:hypothetical protein